jgi:hypothetical protein
MEHKAIKLQFKAEQEGQFTARIATLNVVDSDGDITRPGAFPIGKEILISAYQHGSWQGALPVGKAVIKEAGDAILAEGQFNLGSAAGREHYETVKFTGNLQEWSYGFWPTKWNMDEVDGKQVRILEKVDPVEISPVLKGAGVGTATLDIKGEGLPFAEHFDTVLATVSGLVERSKALADLRRKEGRVLSATNRSRIQSLLQALSSFNEVSADLQALLDETDPNAAGKALPDARRALLEYSRILTNLY